MSRRVFFGAGAVAVGLVWLTAGVYMLATIPSGTGHDTTGLEAVEILWGILSVMIGPLVSLGGVMLVVESWSGDES